VVSEAGSYLRLIDSCITQLKAQGPSRTCNESKEEEEEEGVLVAEVGGVHPRRGDVSGTGSSCSADALTTLPVSLQLGCYLQPG